MAGEYRMKAILIIIAILHANMVFCEDQMHVENLKSETHAINQSLAYTQILMTWDTPVAYSQLDGYFMAFNQNKDYQLDNTNTTGAPYPGNSRLLNCSGDDDVYYFHIAPAYFDFNIFEYVMGQTSTKGPYLIDTVTNNVDQAAPSAAITLSSVTKENVFIVDLKFNEVVTGFEVSDLTVSNGRILSFIPDDIHPEKNFRLEIKPIFDGLVKIYIPEGVVSDIAGNLNVSSSLTLQYGTYSVPALNIWGIAFFMLALILSNKYATVKHY